ncbi:HK97-gp10 family putative phage morphogenesis protein, partial [Streptococcus agalactiae]
VKPTGATRRSIKLEFSNQSTVAKVKAGTNYSGYLETGTRLMEEQPFMKPALDSVIDNFIKDLARVE